MSVRSRAVVLRHRPALGGLVLAAALVAIDALLGRVDAAQAGVLLFAGGAVGAVWGDGRARDAGVAAGVAGLATLVAVEVRAAVDGLLVPVVLVVLVLALVGGLSQ